MIIAVWRFFGDSASTPVTLSLLRHCFAAAAALMMMSGARVNAASPPSIVSFSVTNGQARLTFSSQAGIHYSGQKSASVAGPWQVFAAIVGTGSQATLADPAIASQQQQYYRVVD